jgi:hypothetical protein
MKILKKVYEFITEIENAKNDLVSAMYFIDLKKYIEKNMKYNKPDIVVCDSCKHKGGAECCRECDRGTLFEPE